MPKTKKEKTLPYAKKATPLKPPAKLTQPPSSPAAPAAAPADTAQSVIKWASGLKGVKNFRVKVNGKEDWIPILNPDNIPAQITKFLETAHGKVEITPMNSMGTKELGKPMTFDAGAEK